MQRYNVAPQSICVTDFFCYFEKKSMDRFLMTLPISIKNLSQ